MIQDMKALQHPFFKGFLIPFVLVFFLCMPWSACGQGNSPSCGLSKQYAITSAQLADEAYTYARDAHFTPWARQSSQNMDTALYYLEQSAIAMDSAIYFAKDSDQVALQYAGISKEEAMHARHLLSLGRSTPAIHDKQAFAKDASFLCAHAVVDAYHASFYFTDTCHVKKNEEAPKDSVPAAPAKEKELTKLDVDQTLFVLLNQHINEKEQENKREIAKLEQELKTQKDPAKVAKLKAEIKKLEQQDNSYVTKNKDVTEKLNQINSQIETRDKNPGATQPDDGTVFSRGINRPPDQWNKQVVMDAPLPEGLIYQVQIGVYKNAISPQIFKGLTPLFGQTVPAGISYATGMFEKLADATQAKTYVKSMGLADAFVVAYYNKKKITLAEAQKLEKK